MNVGQVSVANLKFTQLSLSVAMAATVQLSSAQLQARDRH